MARMPAEIRVKVNVEELAQARLERRKLLSGERRTLMPVTISSADWGVQVRSADGSSTSGMRLEGHAAVFDAWSEVLGGWYPFVERIQRGSFRKVLASKPDVRFLYDHEGMPMARTVNGTLQLEEDAVGLKVGADLADTQQARDLYELVKRGDVTQMSFAWIVARNGDTWAYPDGTCYCGLGYETEGCLCGFEQRTITEFRELLDVSAVTYPAYETTDISARGIATRGEQASGGDKAPHATEGEDGEQRGVQGHGGSSTPGAAPSGEPDSQVDVSAATAAAEARERELQLARRRSCIHHESDRADQRCA